MSKKTKDGIEMGQTYILRGENRDVVAKLSRRLSYSYLPGDYVFTWVAGDRSLPDTSNKKLFGPDEFPLPELLVDNLIKKKRMQRVEEGDLPLLTPAGRDKTKTINKLQDIIAKKCREAAKASIEIRVDNRGYNVDSRVAFYAGKHEAYNEVLDILRGIGEGNPAPPSDKETS